MADPNDLLHAGDLDGARAALIEIVRAKPSDPEARMFLFQLFAILGEWDKSKQQLSLLAKLSPGAQMLSVAYGQAIEAEFVRARTLSCSEAIPVHCVSEGWPLALSNALSAIASGDLERGMLKRDEAFGDAPDTPGVVDGTAFEWIANADSRFGPCLEAIIAGKWGIVPFAEVERIESSGVRDLRDLVWYPVQMAFKSGQSAAAFLPARYSGTELTGTAQQKLARATGWQNSAYGSVGIGQQLLTLSDGTDIGLLSIRNLIFV